MSKNDLRRTPSEIMVQRTKGLNLREHPPPHKQISNKKMKQLENKIDNRTITKVEYEQYTWNKKFAKKRRAGVTKFWDMEASRILKEDPATRNWDTYQVKDILAGKTPKYDGKPIYGHHAYSASKYPHLAHKGEVIYPATHNEHFHGWHGSDWKKSLPGKPIKEINDF